MTVDARPRMLLLAGPNGAGKTTFSRKLLERQGQPLPFLNADVEARKLEPNDISQVALKAASALSCIIPNLKR